MIDKLFEKFSRYLQNFISQKYKLNHKYQNKNQITNCEIILNLFKVKF